MTLTSDGSAVNTDPVRLVNTAEVEAAPTAQPAEAAPPSPPYDGLPSSVVLAFAERKMRAAKVLENPDKQLLFARAALRDLAIGLMLPDDKVLSLFAVYLDTAQLDMSEARRLELLAGVRADPGPDAPGYLFRFVRSVVEAEERRAKIIPVPREKLEAVAALYKEPAPRRNGTPPGRSRPAAGTGDPAVGLSLKAREQNALRVIAKHPVAVQGNGGEDTLMGMLGICRAHDLPEDVAERIFWQHYNPRCVPPWTEAEAERVRSHHLADAYKRPVDPSRFLDGMREKKLLKQTEITFLVNGKPLHDPHAHGRVGGPAAPASTGQSGVVCGEGRPAVPPADPPEDDSPPPDNGVPRLPQPVPLNDRNYCVIAGRLATVYHRGDYRQEEYLATFRAWITEEVVRDDGQEQQRLIAVAGCLPNGTLLTRVEIPAGDFDGMAWVTPSWGPRATICAGRDVKSHLRVAISVLSPGYPNYPTRTVYAHTGWREVNGRWVYLDADGAIGSEGRVPGVSVSLPEDLSRFRLELPKDQADEIDAVRSSLRMLGWGPDRILIPALAAPYRAVVGDTGFSMSFVGTTSVGKSETTALLQQHQGREMDRKHLPAGWNSTPNYNASLAFDAKDALLVVDDFVPGAAGDPRRKHQEAEALLRDAANGKGRGRCRTDGSRLQTRRARGLIVSTGEEGFRGQSLNGRTVIVEIKPGDLGLPTKPNQINEELRKRQDDAAAGRYATAMGGYVRWLAGRYPEAKSSLAKERTEERKRFAGAGQHGQTAEHLAELYLGLKLFLRYALVCGAITDEERTGYLDRARKALAELGQEQAQVNNQQAPTTLFFELLGSAIQSGQAHLTALDGSEPSTRQAACGWRNTPHPTFHDRSWVPMGKPVGWIDPGKGAVYLNPQESFRIVKEVGEKAGEPIGVTDPTAMWKRLGAADKIVDREKKDGRWTIRRTVSGRVTHVVYLRLKDVLPDEASKTEVNLLDGSDEV